MLKGGSQQTDRFRIFFKRHVYQGILIDIINLKSRAFAQRANGIIAFVKSVFQ